MTQIPDAQTLAMVPVRAGALMMTPLVARFVANYEEERAEASEVIACADVTSRRGRVDPGTQGAASDGG
jgi:hypothetical protein